MFKNVLLTLSIPALLISFTSLAQPVTFQLQLSRSAQEDVAAVIQNSAGNFVIATITYSPASAFDAGFIEISPTGSILQTKTVSTTGNELLKSIVQTTDGGYLVTGSFFTTANDYDWMVMKLDASFNLTWFKRLGVTGASDNANRGFQVSASRYGVTGSVSLGGSTKPAVVMLNANGTLVSQGYLTTNQFASPDYRGRYLGGGEIGISHLANAVSLMDTSGALISSYGFSLGTYSTDVRQTAGGRIVVSATGDVGSPGGSTVVLGVLNHSLTSLQHAVKFSDSGNDLSAVEFLIAGGRFVVLANASSQTNGSNSPLIIKTDSTGSLIWCKNYKPSGVTNCQAKALIRTSDNGYLLAGRMSSGGPYTVFIAKLDSAGNSVCNTNPYTLTSGTVTPVAVTPHTAFTGGITTLNPLATSTPAVTYTPTVICTSVGVGDPELAAGPVVFPSLFSEGFYVRQTGSEKTVMEMFDCSGRCILKKLVGLEEYVPAGMLAPGHYVAVISAGKRIYRQRIIKIADGF